METLGGLVIVAVLAAAATGLIILFSRASNRQQAIGQPSLPIRVAALILGLTAAGGMLLTKYFSLQIAVAAAVLLGYGLFGFFATVKRRPAPQPAQQPPTIGSLEVPKKKLWQWVKIPLIGCGGLIAVLVAACLVYSI